METKTFKIRDENGKVLLALNTYDSVFFSMCQDKESLDFLKHFENAYVTISDYVCFDVKNNPCANISEYFLISVKDLLSCKNEKDYFCKCADVCHEVFDEVKKNEDIT